jgi:hypothetical protein
VGGALLIASAVETAAWISDSNQSNTDRQNVPKTVTDVCATEINAAAADACQQGKNATTVSTLAWVFGSIGVVLIGSGTVLLLTDHGNEGSATARAENRVPHPVKPSFEVVPAFGPKGGTMGLKVTF